MGWSVARSSLWRCLEMDRREVHKSSIFESALAVLFTRTYATELKSKPCQPSFIQSTKHRSPICQSSPNIFVIQLHWPWYWWYTARCSKEAIATNYLSHTPVVNPICGAKLQPSRDQPGVGHFVCSYNDGDFPCLLIILSLVHS